MWRAELGCLLHVAILRGGSQKGLVSIRSRERVGACVDLPKVALMLFRI